MPVIQKPPDRGPIFGHGVQIVIGSGLAQQLREWQQKKREAESSPVDQQDRDEDVSGR